MRKSIVLLAALFAHAVAAPAGAVVVEKKSLQQLAAESPVVVIGVVVGVAYAEVATSQKPHTRYDIRLFDVVVGKERLGKAAGETMSLHFYGGLDRKNVFEAVVGMPELKLGETYLLMLRGGEWWANPIAGWHQGAFRIIGIDANAKALMALDGSVLVGLDKESMKFATPNAPETRTGGESPENIREEGGAGIKLDGRDPQLKGAPLEQLKRAAPVLKAPIRGASPYREDNVEELEAADAKRLEAAQAAVAPKSPMQSAIDALGGVRPLTLDAALAEIRKTAAANAAAHAQMKFSLEPTPLPDRLEPKRPTQR